MKKDEKFFNWLNNTIFWKNFSNMKSDKTDKRIVQAIEHGVKQKGLARSFTTRKARRARGGK